MNLTRPYPVKLTADQLEQLDLLATRTGLNRSQLLRLSAYRLLEEGRNRGPEEIWKLWIKSKDRSHSSDRTKGNH